MSRVSINATPQFEYKKGNISSTLTIEKCHMTIDEAKQYVSKLNNCVGFCVAVKNKKKPNKKKEYVCHFKEGNGTIQVGKQWHTYLFKQPINTTTIPKVRQSSDTNTDEEEKSDIKININNNNKKKEIKKDPKMVLSLDCELGKLLGSLAMEGIIEYEKANTFWLLKLGKEWQENKTQFAKLTDKLYNNELWYKNGIERGKQYANLCAEKNVNIATVPPTAISGLHITLGRFDVNDTNKPLCFIEGDIVKFKIKRLVCFPPFWTKPKNMPGQEIDKNGYQYYATHWMSLEIEFVDFKYKTRFPPHISLCNIAVKLKHDHVQKLNQIDTK